MTHRHAGLDPASSNHLAPGFRQNDTLCYWISRIIKLTAKGVPHSMFDVERWMLNVQLFKLL
jgi:hypothetical protein